MKVSLHGVRFEGAGSLHAWILVTQRLRKETETSRLTLCFMASGLRGQVQVCPHICPHLSPDCKGPHGILADTKKAETLVFIEDSGLSGMLQEVLLVAMGGLEPPTPAL